MREKAIPIIIEFTKTGIVLSNYDAKMEALAVIEHHPESELETTHGRMCNILLQHVKDRLKEAIG